MEVVSLHYNIQRHIDWKTIRKQIIRSLFKGNECDGEFGQTIWQRENSCPKSKTTASASMCMCTSYFNFIKEHFSPLATYQKKKKC